MTCNIFPKLTVYQKRSCGKSTISIGGKNADADRPLHTLEVYIKRAKMLMRSSAKSEA